MVNMNSLDAQLPVFQALSSEIRIRIMNLILTQNGINLKQLANSLQISVSTLSPHIARLADCGLIRIVDVPASHGTQKCCYPETEQLLILFDPLEHTTPLIQEEIPIGCFSDFEVTPTCGLATSVSFLGKLDEPRSFARMDHMQANILWFTTGYIEYILPNSVPAEHQIDQLTITFELSSEAPQYNNDWPSDIEFSLNGTKLGIWTCPGDFGGRPGDQNPPWWYPFLNQYGLLKRLTINTKGTWLDDTYLSSVTVRDLGLNAQSVLKFRFSVHEDAPHPGGFTLYGRGFGDHNQGIRMTVEYSPEDIV